MMLFLIILATTLCMELGLAGAFPRGSVCSDAFWDKFQQNEIERNSNGESYEDGDGYGNCMAYYFKEQQECIKSGGIKDNCIKDFLSQAVYDCWDREVFTPLESEGECNNECAMDKFWNTDGRGWCHCEGGCEHTIPGSVGEKMCDFNCCSMVYLDVLMNC